MDLQLTDKLALVTGSTAGIGLSIAKTLAAEGARVIINGRTPARVDEAIAAIRKDVPQAKLESFAGDRRFAEIRLGPLDHESHRAVVEALLGVRRAADATARRLYEATEGKPLFTRELLRALLDAGQISADASGS